jgi:hypothetical protein
MPQLNVSRFAELYEKQRAVIGGLVSSGRGRGLYLFFLF